MPDPRSAVPPPGNAFEVNPSADIVLLQQRDMDVDMELPELPDYESPVEDLNSSGTDTGYDSPNLNESGDMDQPEWQDFESPPVSDDLSDTDPRCRSPSIYDSPCLYESEERECHDYV